MQGSCFQYDNSHHSFNQEAYKAAIVRTTLLKWVSCTFAFFFTWLTIAREPNLFKQVIAGDLMQLG